jgi:hypothetical protein
MGLDETLEEIASTDDDRIRLFGQRDHVRLYSPHDYPLRLADSGFAVDVYLSKGMFAPETARKYSLIDEEAVYRAEKPA